MDPSKNGYFSVMDSKPVFQVHTISRDAAPPSHSLIAYLVTLWCLADVDVAYFGVRRGSENSCDTCACVCVCDVLSRRDFRVLLNECDLLSLPPWPFRLRCDLI